MSARRRPDEDADPPEEAPEPDAATWVSGPGEGLSALVRALQDEDVSTRRAAPLPDRGPAEGAVPAPSSEAPLRSSDQLGSEDSTVRARRLPLPGDDGPILAGPKDSTIRLEGTPERELPRSPDSTIKLPARPASRRPGSCRLSPGVPLDLHQDEPTSGGGEDSRSPSSMRLAPDEPLDLHSDFEARVGADPTLVSDSQGTVKNLFDDTDDDVSETVVNLPDDLRAIVEAKTVVLSEEIGPDERTIVVPEGFVDPSGPTRIGDFTELSEEQDG